MKERAQKNNMFLYIKIPEVPFIVSYKVKVFQIILLSVVKAPPAQDIDAQKLLKLFCNPLNN